MTENKLKTVMNQNASNQDNTYPNFLYIGASKAGSSWIYEVLREHPDVFVPHAKDIQFFDVYYQKGIDWYLSFFREGKGKTAIGEISHDYFLSEQAAARIYECLPYVKLFCCLREPTEKTISAYLYNKTTHLDKNITFEDYAFHPRILKLNDYYNNLLPFYNLFPREQILVLFYDELKQDPATFIERMYAFLEVNVDFTPPSLYRKVLPAREPRIYFLSHLVYKTGLGLRKMGLTNFVGQVKRNSIFESFFYKTIEQKPEFPSLVKQNLREHFQKDYSKLSKLINREIPPSWLQDF